MNISDAVELIDNNKLNPSTPQRWADLGCGTGTFTIALANLLPDESFIIAIDKSSIHEIPDHINNITIEKRIADFIKDNIPSNLDGIIMANSLHYVKEKGSFINKILDSIKKGGNLIIVEYDTEKSNHWVPYPVSFNSLKNLFEEKGFSVTKLIERLSVYRKENIYSALIEL